MIADPNATCTAIVAGNGGPTGVALVEIYRLPRYQSVNVEKCPKNGLFRLGLLVAALSGSIAFAQDPYGLDTWVSIGPYLNQRMPPYDGAFPFPEVLSATGAFTDVVNVVLTDGLIP